MPVSLLSASAAVPCSAHFSAKCASRAWRAGPRMLGFLAVVPLDGTGDDAAETGGDVRTDHGGHLPATTSVGTSDAFASTSFGCVWLRR